MKRFLLFAGRDYYPSKGVGDLIGSFDTVEEAQQAAPIADEYTDWSQVYDGERDRVVAVWADERYPGGWRTVDMRRGGVWDETGYEHPDTGQMVYWSELVEGEAGGSVDAPLSAC